MRFEHYPPASQGSDNGVRILFWTKAAMTAYDVELDEQLVEAGNKLVDPPASVDELLALLNVSIWIPPSHFQFLFLLIS